MEISKTKLGDLGTMSGIDAGNGSDEVVLPAGKVVADRFEIIGVIGRGGMGTVYEVQDHMRDERVALKFLRPELVSSDTARQRFLNEAKIAISLSHPHIISVYDVVKYVNTCFLTMELLKGQSLRARLQELAKAGQQMPLNEALRIAKDLTEALAYAHRSTIHRDIKPENIWVMSDGRAKLMDFGIARLQDQTSNLTKTTSVLGTAYYMAPEQLVGAGQVDHRADQYSLGVVLYEMLTGALPIGRHEPVSDTRNDISKKVDAVIGTMMSGKTEGRYPNDEALLNALSGLQKSGANKPFPKVPVKAIGIVLVVTVMVGAGYSGWRWVGQRNKAEALRLVQEQATAEVLENAKQADDDTWSRAQKDGKLQGYQTYLSQFPEGAHGEEAKKEVERLTLVRRVEDEAKKSKQAKLMEQKAAAPASVKVHRTKESYFEQVAPPSADHKTWRLEIVKRPGCAVFADSRVLGSYTPREDHKQDFGIYTGGSCPNGLLEGLVKYTFGGPNDDEVTYFNLYRQGKEVFSARINDNPKYSTYRYNIFKFNGDAYKSIYCMGNSASERAKYDPLCEEAARIVGMDFFNK